MSKDIIQKGGKRLLKGPNSPSEMEKRVAKPFDRIAAYMTGYHQALADSHKTLSSPK